MRRIYTFTVFRFVVSVIVVFFCKWALNHPGMILYHIKAKQGRFIYSIAHLIQCSFKVGKKNHRKKVKSKIKYSNKKFKKIIKHICIQIKKSLIKLYFLSKAKQKLHFA